MWQANFSPRSWVNLPADQFSTGFVVDCVSLNYAGLIWIKSGQVRKPVVTKAHVALLVSLSVKALHLEWVTELSTAAFIATFCRFIARRGKRSFMWSDHGTNFIGAARVIHELIELVKNSEEYISDFCTTRGIQWKFTPEHAPHFGGLWEAAMKAWRSILGGL